jgi:hypothetical protein
MTAGAGTWHDERMAAASRRKSLLQRSGRSTGGQEPPGDLSAAGVPDDDLLEADEAGEDGDAETPGGAATVRAARSALTDVDVVEAQAPAGSGFRQEGADDVWSTDDPRSEEVRLDPMFGRLQFHEPPVTDAEPSVPLPLPERPRAAPPPDDAARRKHGAVDGGASNRPAATEAARARSPARPAERPPSPPLSATPGPAPDAAPPTPYASAPPQPQAAQDRKRATEPAVTARLSTDMFGTPVPTGRVVDPDGPTIRQSRSDLQRAPAPTARGDQSDSSQPVPAAGVLAVGGAAMVSLAAAALLLVVVIALVLVSALSGGGSTTPEPASVEVAPVEGAPTPEPGAVDEAPPTEEPPPTDEAPAEEPPPEGAPPAPGPRRPKPKPAPEPAQPAPAPAPVAPAPAPPPPPPPAPVEDDEDKKGKKKKKK